jgi:hypothetical protein
VILGAWILLLVVTNPCAAQYSFESGSDGHDGALYSTSQTLVIDMTDHPDGIYHYTSIHIPAGVNVYFASNEEKTPVVWLVQGDVSIDGNIYMNGEDGLAHDAAGSQTNLADGGPGGYAGGLGALRPDQSGGVMVGTAGQGPGGGATSGADSGGAGGTYSYGNSVILPLLGGSGGGGGGVNASWLNGGNGGGGGGAILIASSTRIIINGSIYAKGGAGGTGLNGGWGDNDAFPGGGGSGGAIRIISNEVVGTGSMNAQGGTVSPPWGNPGGDGRLRIEAFVVSFSTTNCAPAPSVSEFPGLVFLPDSIKPTVAISSIGGVGVPTNPQGDLFSPDIQLNTTDPVSVNLTTTNVPVGTDVTVRAVRERDTLAEVTGNIQAGGVATLTGLTLPEGKGVVQAWVTYAPTIPAGQTLKVNGKTVKTLQVGANLGGESQLIYITEEGEKIPESSVEEIRLLKE